MSLLHNDGCNYWSSSSGQSYFYCINWRFPPSYLVVWIWNAFPWCKTCLWTFHAFHFKCTPTVRKAGTCTKYLDERVCGSNGIIYDNHGSSPWREWHTMCRNLQSLHLPQCCFIKPSVLPAVAAFNSACRGALMDLVCYWRWHGVLHLYLSRHCIYMFAWVLIYLCI